MLPTNFAILKKDFLRIDLILLIYVGPIHLYICIYNIYIYIYAYYMSYIYKVQ